ncbi:hypothetical protein [Microbacterium sp. YY-01]
MDDLEVRREALVHAVKIASEQQVGAYEAEVVVNIAKTFEDYLLGKEGK